jgi:hypothetical protein
MKLFDKEYNIKKIKRNKEYFLKFFYIISFYKKDGTAAN